MAVIDASQQSRCGHRRSPHSRTRQGPRSPPSAIERVVIACSSDTATVTARLRLRSVTREAVRTAPVKTAGIRHKVATRQDHSADDRKRGREGHQRPDEHDREDADRGSTSGRALAYELAAAAGLAEDRVGGPPCAQVEHGGERGEHGREHAASDRQQARCSRARLLRR